MSEKSDRLDLVLKASNEGVWDWDVENGEIYYSNRVLMFLGYGRIGAPNIFTDPEPYIHPEDVEVFRKKIDRVLSRNGRFIAAEPRIKSQEGGWKWFRVRGVPVRDKEGQLLRIVGSLIDISKRKFAEIQLAEERGLIDLLLDSVPVNVYFKDVESRFVRANLATAQRMGAGTVDQLIGKTDHDFFEAEHADSSRSMELELMKTGESQQEVLEHEVWEDGRESWVLVTKKVWYGMNGDIRGTFGVTHEVTELLETQNELERIADELKLVNRDISQERHLLKLVIDSIPMFVYFKDVNSSFVLVNQGMAELVGEDSPDQVIGKHDRDYFSPRFQECSESDELKIMKTGKPIIKKLERIAWKDQHVTWSLSSKYPWRDSTGKIIGTYGISGDVTELVETRNKSTEIANALSEQNVKLADQLALAREIQQSAVPSSIQGMLSEEMEVSFSHFYQPAGDLAGDFLEVIPLRPDLTGFLVCDVMGHGVRSALIVSMLRGLLEKQRVFASSPSEVLSGLNEGLSHLLERTHSEMFATALYGVIDLGSNQLRIASAGHPSPIISLHGETQVFDLKGKARGPALGMVAGIVYQECVIPLDGLEAIWSYTDGIFEACSDAGEEYGLKRLCESFEVLQRGESLLKEVVQSALDFSNQKGFEDDICLLGVEFSRRA